MAVVGSKGGEGVYQRIICWIPPHDLYIEPFAGSAAVWRHKRPARRSVLIDLDPAALDLIGNGRSTFAPSPGALDGAGGMVPATELILGDGLDYLRRLAIAAGVRVMIYCDPPYLRETRRDPTRDYYRREWTRKDHEAFLDLAVEAPWPMLISGYWSQLYADRLAGWDSEAFTAATRGGLSTEWIWSNRPRPAVLHDYRYIGDGFAERWRIHKRQRSWARLLRRMPELERRAMLASLAEAFPGDLAEYFRDGRGGARSHQPADPLSPALSSLQPRPAKR